MVRAILAGRKTQTRRIIKPDWLTLVEECLRINGKWVWHAMACDLTMPFGVPGDHLWVRETFKPINEMECHYRAQIGWHVGGPWKPSIFMPRKFSRITLEITGVRVERLKDISEADAMAEGITLRGTTRFENECCIAYKQLWDSINGPGAFEKNPYVWVIEFKKL